MQQDRNKSRRPSSSIQQNSARRQGKSRKAYDWTQDRRPSNQNRRRTQGYQEQTLDFSGGNVTFENHSSGYADNSIQFPSRRRDGPITRTRAAVRASREASGPVRTRPPTPQMGAAPAMASGPRTSRAPGGPRAAGATAPRRRTSAARPGGRAEKAPSDSCRCPPPQGHPPPDGAGAAALRHRGGRLPHRDHALQDKHLRSGGRWRGGAGGGRLFQR